jgi:hypothetical protein
MQNCNSFTRRPNRGWCAQKAQPGLSIGYTDLAAVDAAAPMQAPDSIALTLHLAAWPSPDASKVYAESACKCAATCTDACPAELGKDLLQAYLAKLLHSICDSNCIGTRLVCGAVCMSQPESIGDVSQYA